MPSKIRRTVKPAEKEVRKTDKTVSVGPVKGSRAPGRKTAAGIDQRRQLVGSDEPRGTSRPR